MVYIIHSIITKLHLKKCMPFIELSISYNRKNSSSLTSYYVIYCIFYHRFSNYFSSKISNKVTLITKSHIIWSLKRNSHTSIITRVLSFRTYYEILNVSVVTTHPSQLVLLWLPIHCWFYKNIIYLITF